MNLLRNSGLFVAAAALGAATFLASCSDEFLTPSVPSALTADALSSPAGIQGAIVGAYSQLSGRGSRFGSYNWVSGSIQGGDANKGTETGDFVAINEVVEYQLQTTSRLPSDKWNQNYNGAVAANAAINIALRSEDPTVTESFRNNMVGQGIFLRSHYFFELYKHFENFVYFDENTPALEYSTQPNMNMLDAVISDMARAVDLLPETQGALGMANRWAARTYHAKMLMFAGRYADALPILKDVMENGKTSGGADYQLLDNYSDVFNAEFDNNAESIFAIQAAANTGSVNNANYAFDLAHLQGTPIGGCCGFWQPSFDLVDSYRVDDDGLPFTDGSYRDPANRIASDLNVESADAFTVDGKPVDPRLDHGVGRRGIPYLDWGPHQGKAWIRDQAHGGPFSPKKFIYYSRQTGTLQDGSSWTSGYTAMNFNILRYADVLLLAAEAAAQTDDLDLAKDLVNMIRMRAANEDSWVKNDDGSNAANYQIGMYDSFDSKAEALEKVYFERKLELSNEGHRFFDLVRWDRAADFLPGYIDYEEQFLPLQFGNATFNANQDRFWPIPQTQIDLQQGVLTQNSGY